MAAPQSSPATRNWSKSRWGRKFGDNHRAIVRGCRKPVSGALRRAGASVVDRDDGCSAGVSSGTTWRQYDHGLRHAVQQEHRVAGAADRVVDLHAVDFGLAVREPELRAWSMRFISVNSILFGVWAPTGWVTYSFDGVSLCWLFFAATTRACQRDDGPPHQDQRRAAGGSAPSK